jgi:hypothetical protein
MYWKARESFLVENIDKHMVGCKYDLVAIHSFSLVWSGVRPPLATVKCRQVL